MGKVFIGIMGLLLISLLLRLNNSSREDQMIQLAIETVRIQADLPEEVEVKFVDKKESSILDFYMVKLLAVRKDKEVPIVVYVDRAAEKVIVGDLFIRGENITKKEISNLRISKIGIKALGTGETSFAF